jgi:transcriptional regulator with XRE-family HTH domain
VDTLSAALGRTIRRYRLAAGLSQEALAERAEIHRNHVGFLERGERSPTVDVLVRIGEALEVPGWVLLKEAQDAAESAFGGAKADTRLAVLRDPDA